MTVLHQGFITFFLLLFLMVPHAHSKTTKIGFLLSTLQEERYQKDKKYFEDKAHQLGAEVVFYASDNSERVQARKMENLLLKNVDVVVIQPVNSHAASTLVEMAKESQVPVIAYDRIIENADLDLYVTQNSREVGRLQAKAAVEATKGAGNYILLMGQAGHSVAQEITEGVKEVLKDYPKIKIVVEQNHDGWSASKAMATVENALTKFGGKIDAILANNSGMANGAVQAISGFDPKLAGKIFVAGADADLAAIKNITKGLQHFEVLKDIQLLAETSAQIAYDLANGKGIDSKDSLWNGKKKVKVINTPVFPVSKNDIEKTIIKRGFHTRESIYQ